MHPTRREQQEGNVSSTINLFLIEMTSVLNVQMVPYPSHMSRAGAKNESLPVFKRKNKTLFCIICAEAECSQKRPEEEPNFRCAYLPGEEPEHH